MKKNIIKEPKISKKVIDYLEKNKYRYEIIKHRTTYTSWDTAQTEKVKPNEVAKTLVIKVDKDWIIAILPSNKNLNKKDLLNLINSNRKKNKEKLAQKIDFADERWLKKNMKIGKLGAVPPFRELLKADIYFDKMLSKNKKIYVSSGEYDASLRILLNQYLKNEKPIIGKFSIKKA
ncbi:MAG: YbaK/EbsC family protein [Parcubacteria group bacterium]|jgi:prolyl-tRNA editing enzyme YbaK/EbsC (Cys-tRNA(Pro) deacylase)